MKEQLDHLLNKINRVTAYHRHGQKVSKKDLDALSNAQIEFEEVYKQVSVEPEVKVNFADTLETIIKYYNDLQTEAPDNLSLGRFHTNMIILIEKFEEYKSKFSA